MSEDFFGIGGFFSQVIPWQQNQHIDNNAKLGPADLRLAPTQNPKPNSSTPNLPQRQVSRE